MQYLPSTVLLGYMDFDMLCSLLLSCPSTFIYAFFLSFFWLDKTLFILFFFLVVLVRDVVVLPPVHSFPFPFTSSPFARLSLTLLTVMTKKCQRPRRRIITSMDRHSTCPVAEAEDAEEVQCEVCGGGEGGVAWRCRGHLQVAGFQRHFPSFLRLLRFIFPLLVHVLFSLLLLLLLSCFLLCFFVMSCVFPLFFVGGGSDNELMFLIDEEIWVAIRTDCG